MKPILAITMGDPSGIGPEITLKAAARPDVRRVCRPVVYGDTAWLRRTQERALRGHAAGHLSLLSIDGRKGLVFPRLSGDSVAVVDFSNVPREGVRFGASSVAGGKASGEYIEAAVNSVLHGEAAAIVTAPINKVSFRLGGWGERFVGHTEMLADLTRATEFGLMLVCGRLRAIHVTSHVALRKVAPLITRTRVLSTIRLADRGLRSMGISRPRIAVCALNPHAGDGGLMGTEERRIIGPAVRLARRSGLRADGPFPADVVWPRVVAGDYDAGVAMYHDQGQIAVKLAGFRQGRSGTTVHGVNVTLGLPIIRTSVAHGTAYEIAGRGVASEESLVDAVKLACKMASIQ